jgi:hypothetical protein
LRFKEYYQATIRQSKLDIFEQVFDKYYAKGFFGTLSESVVKKQQKSWFEKFLIIIENKDYEGLMSVLEDRQNLVTREWFSRLCEVDIMEKSRKEIEQAIQKKLK